MPSPRLSLDRLRSDYEQAVAGPIHLYTQERYHEALDNATPADVYFGRAAAIVNERETVKQRTLAARCGLAGRGTPSGQSTASPKSN